MEDDIFTSKKEFVLTVLFAFVFLVIMLETGMFVWLIEVMRTPHSGI